MLCKLHSLGLHGITGYLVTAECDLTGGLPSFDLVGLPDAAVKEARERVRSAVKNCGFQFPVSRITVNLAPADRKKGAALDPLNDWWVQDCSAAIQNILVEAADLGLGTLWIGVWPDPKRVLAVQRDLELPEHIAPLGAVAIGRPDKVKEPTDRYEAEKVFFGKYEERG